MKIPYFLLLPFIFLLKGSDFPQFQALDLDKLTGNIHLTLKHGVWKLWEEQPIYQDMTLDLVCERGQCQPQAWGYAPKYNQDVDHLGTVKVLKTDSIWQLNVNLNIQPHPWQTEVQPADYKIKLIPYKGGIIGSYQGKFNQKSLKGSVIGQINPLWPIPVPHYQPLQSQEHPRLVFRSSQLSALREKAKTPQGQAILTQLKKSLQKPPHYQGFVPNGGYQATGHCFFAVLNQDTSSADRGWQLVENSMQKPEDTLLKQSPTVAGIALAYDLCYPFWTETRRQQVTRWLQGQINNLMRGDSPQNGWNSNPGSNWNARAKGAAGLAALAIMDDPSLPPTDLHLSVTSQAMMAQRQIKRYFTTAIGNRGFGTEGDHYTTEPLVLTVFPFLIAYRNAMGQDLITNAKPAWILPHYLSRAIPNEGQLPIATYGRHRRYMERSLFATGLELSSPDLLPAILWLFEQNLGLKGDKNSDINLPHEAVFAFVGYPQKIQPENPEKQYDRVLVDAEKGFYNFRNRWQNSNDIVANIYLKHKPLGGTWSFPDVGSFRIWGLGEQWANAGLSEPDWHNENVVIVPHIRPWKESKLVKFQSRLNGSGIVSLATSPVIIKQKDSVVKMSLLRSFGVDYSKASGSPGLFVIVDQFVGDIRAKPFQDKTWIMQTPGKVTLKKAEKTFLIQSANGATLKGVFLAPESVKMTYQPNELGGQIRASGGDNFFVIMTLQKEKIPDFKIEGFGLNTLVTIGKQTVRYKNNQLIFSQF